MGLFGKRAPCAICGGKVSGLFPAKVEGQLICKECYGNVDLPDGTGRMSLEEFMGYRRFREENQRLKSGFVTTEQVSLGVFGANFVFDQEHRLFCLSPDLDRTIYEGRQIVSFTIAQDDTLLFEGSAAGVRRYDSDVPDRVMGMAPLLEQFRVQREIQRSMERAAEQRRRDNPDAPPPPPPAAPTVDIPEPFERFYVSIKLDHPYWPDLEIDKKGPTFSTTHPDARDYLREYREDMEQLEHLAEALWRIAFPDAPDLTYGDPAPAPAADVQAAAPAAGAADAFEEIKRYKELLDLGIITQEEFAAKKRELLGI